MKPKSIPFLLAAGALLAAPAALRPAASSRANAAAMAVKKETRGEVVGKVVASASRAANKRHMQVQAGRFEWTVQIPKDARIVGKDGKSISVHEIKTETYIRATGKRVGNTRMEADHLWVIGDRLDFRDSPYYKAAGFEGYIHEDSGP